MINIKNKHIEITQGDSGTLNFKFSQNMTVNDTILFTVKKHLSGEEIFHLSATGNGTDEVSIDLATDKTNIEPGIYFYDIRIINGTSVKTPFKPKRFLVIGAVGTNGL